jgi:hypothetical protein
MNTYYISELKINGKTFTFQRLTLKDCLRAAQEVIEEYDEEGGFDKADLTISIRRG